MFQDKLIAEPLTQPRVLPTPRSLHIFFPADSPQGTSIQGTPNTQITIFFPADSPQGTSIQGTPNTQITIFFSADSPQGTSIQSSNYAGQSQAPEDPSFNGSIAQGSTLLATVASFESRG
ncbi:hypothetical protein H9Q69_007162 [Fusarium xylarioides]|nr:hypothetical protein H9Q69_007162 [Fusarium xylarioides]KAG5819822.1 hypothetical protein H9Q71_000863 [Fusarium xylarioides]KAG5825929.1 hypothetical protein H9Q74_003978 [Fusarium xylarioides]